MDEILLFESSGSIEYFTDSETIEEDITKESNDTVLADKVVEDPEDKLKEDPEEKLEEDPEEKLEKDPEDLKEEYTEKGKENDVLQVSDLQTDFYLSDDSECLSDNKIITISENIISKPLNEYTVSESLQLYIFISLFLAGFVILVRRAVLKWS